MGYVQRCTCGETTARPSGQCRICFVEQQGKDKDYVKEYKVDDIKEEIHHVLTEKEREVMQDKIRTQTGLFITNVSYDPLCIKFYPKNCEGCPFQRFESKEYTGCNRFFIIKTGDKSDYKSNVLRIQLFGGCL